MLAGALEPPPPGTPAPDASPPVAPASTIPPPAPLDGIALSLYYEGPGPELRYERMIDRIVAAGAPTVSVVVQWAQPDIHADEIAPDPKHTPPDADVRRVVRYARARGLSVLVFPILWVEERAIGKWRGTLAPADPDRWWASYHRFVLHYARLAADEGAAAFSVGSEFASLEGETARWHAVIDAVRAVFPGRLLYSANWDHYREVTFWDRLDAIGLTGYARLTESRDPSTEELTAAWRRIRTELLAWRDTIGRPLVFTEIGYPSLDGAAHSPWDYTASAQLDLEEQRRCFEAFARVWAAEPALAGAFFWNGWGPTDGRNTWYTFWGKPAEAVVRAWFATRARGDAPEAVEK